MAKTEQKHIAIRCTYDDMLPLDNLVSMQADLKSVSDADMAKLVKSFKNNGFLFPLWVWKDKQGKLYIIDGVTRLRVLLAARKAGTFQCSAAPVIFVQAKSRNEARELVLYATSEYARLNREGALDLLEKLNWSKFFDEINLEGVKAPKSPTAPKSPQIARTRRKDSFVYMCPLTSLKQQKRYLKCLEILKERGEVWEEVVFDLVRAAAAEVA